MQEKLLQDAEKYKKSNQRRRVWRKLVQIMACVVVFCTTYALILPAITMEKLQCGKEEHIHSDNCYRKVIAEPERLLVCTYESLDVHVHTSECYDSQHHITCGYADYVVHKHTDACKDENGTLVCQLPVVKEHVHTDDCYRILETPEQEPTQAVHRHSTDCYTESRGELICQTPATEGHSHDDACYTKGELLCQLPEQAAHAHDESCSETVLVCDLTVEPHNHGDSCYEQLVCELPEDETHTHSNECSGKVLNCELVEQPHDHTDACWQTNSLCDLSETEGHTHSNDCYEWILECGLAVQDPHSHTDNCYEKISTLTCGLEESTPAETEPVETSAPEAAEPELVCEQEVIQIHSHDEACYETTADGQKQLICTEPVVLEHVHGENCFVTEEADPDEAEAMTCTLAEGHTHEESCYEERNVLTCEKEENHTHEENCYDETGALICTEAENHSHEESCYEKTSVLTCTVAENHTHGNLCYGTWERICGKETHAHTDKCYEAVETADPTVPVGSLEVSQGTLSQMATANADPNSGIALMSVIPEEILAQGDIPGSNLTWQFSKIERDEVLLRIDGEGAVPDYTGRLTERPWLTYYESLGKPYVHLAFGENVTVAGPNAFRALNISTIYWGGVEEISNYAFSYGSGPQKLVLDRNVKKLGNLAFYARYLKSVEMHEGVETLSHSCFTNYFEPNYTLNIPASVKEIPEAVLADVIAYNVHPDNPYYCSVDGVLFTKDMKELVAYPKQRVAKVYQIPQGVTTIHRYAFGGAVSIGQLRFPSSITSIGLYMAQGAHISEFYFEDGCIMQEYAVQDSTLHNSTGLTNVRYPENTETPLFSVFSNCNSTALNQFTHLTIPNKITRIGYLKGTFNNLETITYNAENAAITSDTIFKSTSAYDLIIDTQVNTLPAKFSSFISSSKAVYFRGENYFNAASGAFAGAGEPLQNLSGDFYVDKSGVLYSYDSVEKTAQLVYCPPGITEITVPASIKTETGEECLVTAVRKNSLYKADKLTSITFTAPGNIQKLDAHAMANCPTLSRVNNETTVSSATNLFTGVTSENFGAGVFHNTALSPLTGDLDNNGILDGIGQENLTVNHTEAMDMEIYLSSNGGTMEWVPKGDGVGLYQLLTGDTLIFTVKVDNTKGRDDYSYRIYLRTTQEDCKTNITPGQTYTFDGQSATCYETEDPNTVYLEFFPAIGSAVNIPITAFYPTPNSDGGGVELWGVIQSSQQATENAKRVINADAVIQAQWITEREFFGLSKAVANEKNTISIVGNGSGGGKPSNSLVWTIDFRRSTNTTDPKYGSDFVKSAVFTDFITLPDGFSWNPKLIQALQDGPVQFRTTGSTSYDFTIIDQQTNLKLATVALSSTNSTITNAKAFWYTAPTAEPETGTEPETQAQQGTLAIRWELHNIGEEEMNPSVITFTVYPDAISIDMSKIDTDDDTATYAVRNDVSTDVNYHHSPPPDEPLHASASIPVKGGKATLALQKTSSGATFFGEDVTYTIDLYNTGAVPYVDTDGKTFTIEDALSRYSYIKPEKMEQMFKEYGSDLTIRISNAILAPWQEVTGVDGKTSAYQNSGNSNLGTQTHTLDISITRNEENKILYQVIVDGTTQSAKCCNGETVAAALREAGYAVTELATYTCIWKLHKSDSAFTLDTNTHKEFIVYATIKDTFGMLSTDWPNTHPTEKTVMVLNEAKLMVQKEGSKSKELSYSVSDSVKREAYIYKSVFKGGVEQHDGNGVADGDVLTYYLDFRHRGSGIYKNLPMVDDLYGSQYLLVPAAENTNLQQYNLRTYEDEGIEYYVLEEGVYTDVKVGVDQDHTDKTLNAASITVERVTEDSNDNSVTLNNTTYSYSGIHTTIKWYLPETSNEEYRMEVAYKALVDLSQGGASYTIGNAVWMNDRKNARLYDSIWGGGAIIDFEKQIVLEQGKSSNGDALPEQDVLTDYSMISPGETVTYRIALHNSNNYPFLLTGDKLGDALPESYNDVFRWSTANVALTKIVCDSETLTYEKLDEWEIAESYSGLTGENQQYIIWPSDAKIQFQKRSTIYLYFELTFPTNDGTNLWNQYAAKVNGNRIFNTLYVYRFPSTVEHNLKVPGKVLLQKGVSGMYYSRTKYLPSGTSREHYNNQDIRNRAVMYYVTLYNGADKWLYLDDLYDCLPKGFSFVRMIDELPTEEATTRDFSSIQTIGGTFMGGNGLTEYVNTSVNYRNATITPELNGDNLVFRISAGKGADNQLSYDQEKEQYYLKRGEAIIFAYTCDTGTRENTDDVATNTIAMPYHDYLNTGMTMISDTDLIVYAEDSADFPNSRNDGNRFTKKNQEIVDRYNFPSSSVKEWLVSDVTVIRGNIEPGVTKYTEAYLTNRESSPDPYINGVQPSYIIQWLVRLHNTGTAALVDYTFIDLMPKPYVFEGDIIFNFYDAHNNLVDTQTIATIPDRTLDDTSTPDDQPDDEEDFTLSITDKDFTLSIETVTRDGNEYEMLTIECKTANMAIAEGGYVDVTLESLNPTRDHRNAVYTNRAMLYPEQPFDQVVHGTMLTDAEGKPDGVENYSPVNVAFGHATSSEKRVTEDSRTTNTAVSTNPSKNTIVLENAASPFTYTLTVGNTTQQEMNKLVVIDSLPEPDDRSPFDTSAKRNSNFTVYFADDPAFKVKIIPNDATEEDLNSDKYTLDPSKYTVEFSNENRFGGTKSSDWNGDPLNRWGARTDESRSFRLIIREADSGVLIPQDSKVEITFKARADQNAEPGTIAWNSFGYHFALNGVSGEQEAMPLTVGVAVPSVPSVKKQLVNPNGTTVEATQDLTFSFLVYEGEALTGSFETTEELRSALTDAGRNYMEVPVTVAAGKSESEAVKLKNASWTWVTDNAYTITEIDTTSKYAFDTFRGTAKAHYTFTYEANTVQTIVCKNRLEEWAIEATKINVDEEPLSGAVFALYSPSQEGMLSTDVAAEWNAQQSIQVGGKDWYLTHIAQSGADGILSFTGLLEDSYYLLEIKAPDGYNLPEAGQILYRTECEDGIRSLQVINKPGYELPKTGGAGTTSYTLGGLLLMAAAILLYIHNQKRRKEEMTSF